MNNREQVVDVAIKNLKHRLMAVEAKNESLTAQVEYLIEEDRKRLQYTQEMNQHFIDEGEELNAQFDELTKREE